MRITKIDKKESSSFVSIDKTSPLSQISIFLPNKFKSAVKSNHCVTQINWHRFTNIFEGGILKKTDRVFAFFQHHYPSKFDLEFGEMVYIASSLKERAEIYHMVHQIYQELGYTSDSGSDMWISFHDSLSDTTTIVTEEKGKITGSLTLVFDSPAKLPADELYANELDEIRKDPSKKIFEAISFVVSKEQRTNPKIIAYLMSTLYSIGFDLHEATDLVITVHTKHVSFYQKVLLFDVIGEVKNYPKVNQTPARLLHLTKDQIRKNYQLATLGDPSVKGTFYPLFLVSYQVKKELTEFLALSINPMSEEEKAFFFHDRLENLKKIA